jgi:hypothetical protein
MSGRPRCPACGGNGKCSECFGSGTNVHLNEDEPKCRNCGGNGICPACAGLGFPPRGTADLTSLDL